MHTGIYIYIPYIPLYIEIHVYNKKILGHYPFDSHVRAVFASLGSSVRSLSTCDPNTHLPLTHLYM